MLTQSKAAQGPRVAWSRAVTLLPATGRAAVMMLACGVVLGCAPAIETTRPGFMFANGWQTPIKAAPRLMDDRTWWRGFQDQTLDAMILRALHASPDLNAARLRALAARQETAAIQGATTLATGASARASEGRLRSEDRVIGGSGELGILFDPGRGRQAERFGAAAAAALAEAEQSGARLFLIGEISTAYLQLRHSQQRLILAQQEASRQRQMLSLARRLVTEGEGTRIDVLRSEARLAALEAERRELEGLVDTGILRLTVLAGDAPGQLPPDLMAGLRRVAAQPRSTLAPDPLLPADLIRNRPDLRVEEARYDAARAALGAARAALYPSLSLTGTIDAREVRFRGTETRGAVSSLGPTLRLPVLPLRASRAAVDAAESRVEAAHESWTGAVLTALFEVETALLDYSKAAQNEAAIDRAVALQAQARRLSNAAVREGAATLWDLNILDGDLARAEIQQADARLARAQSFVDLNIRLGMGAQPD
ncbi:MAG: TolC family protein [Rhodobacteraceae bacterium]|nr:MAG: TolC family protein [Paracoccaceae bacterium]